MGLGSAWEYVLAHIKALPIFLYIIYFATLNKISPKLLDAVVKRSKTIPGVKPSEKVNFLGTVEFYKERVKGMLAEMRKTARLGEKAPNPRLFNLKRNMWTNLLNYGGRCDQPLVVVFGSCT